MADTTRDHLANERTFLAWVRTALGLIGLGFVLARMGLFLRQIAVTAASLGAGLDAAHRRTGDPERAMHAGHEFLVSGVVFLVVGTVIGAWSWWHYDHNRRAIEAGRFEPSRRSVLGLAVVVVLGSAGIVGLVLWRVVAG